MKRIRNIIAAVLVITVIGLNIIRSNSANSTESLLNVQALQASAGEAWCDDTSKNPCTIYMPFGPTISGIGQPHGVW